MQTITIFDASSNPIEQASNQPQPSPSVSASHRSLKQRVVPSLPPLRPQIYLLYRGPIHHPTIEVSKDVRYSRVLSTQTAIGKLSSLRDRSTSHGSLGRYLQISLNPKLREEEGTSWLANPIQGCPSSQATCRAEK